MMLRIGGARNTNTGSLSSGDFSSVKPSVLTYNGCFNEHIFHTGQEKDKILSCISHTIKSNDPISHNEEFYLGLFFNSKLDGDGINLYRRPPLNLVVCLDVSGSMAAHFANETKLSVAKKSIRGLVSNLKANDKICIIAFNNEATLILPFLLNSDLSSEELDKALFRLSAKGGTNLEAGIQLSTQQFLEAGVFNGEGGREGVDLENRIIYLTDMCPNMGDTDSQNLLQITRRNAENHLYTTFVGIGLDFDTDMTEVSGLQEISSYHNT